MIDNEMIALGKQYHTHITTMPEMTGMDWAHDHGWISHEQRQEAEHQATQMQHNMNQRLLQWREDQKMYHRLIIERTKNMKIQLEKIVAKRPDQSFEYHIMKDLITKADNIITHSASPNLWDLGRIARIGIEYIQKYNSD